MTRNQTEQKKETRTDQTPLDETELSKVNGGLRIGGVDGESTDDGHKDWIDLK